MPKLIAGMFSSVPDAELVLAAHAYEDQEAFKDGADKLSDDGSDNSLTHAEINSSIVANADTNEISEHEA